MSHTKVGLPATRMPANASPLSAHENRVRLLDLAHRGISALLLDRSRGARLIVHLCNGLATAIADLRAAEDRTAMAERAIDVAKLRIAELLRENEVLQFGVDTVARDMPSGELRKLRRTAVQAAVE